jgi:hypothetical protein
MRGRLSCAFPHVQLMSARARIHVSKATGVRSQSAGPLILLDPLVEEDPRLYWHVGVGRTAS